jgi:hypothetical protein
MAGVSGPARVAVCSALLLVALLVLALAEVPRSAGPLLGACLESATAEDQARSDMSGAEQAVRLASVHDGQSGRGVWGPDPGAAREGAPSCRQTRSPPLA